ncbi:hypothetical protein EV175_000771 [Coemansia sp. RSA 1933]|nr:hypothetical protein EV175_000771 [Coemansia sp. RSA 1933]
MNSTSIDADREAKRKARYRGNPDRARFQRQHNTGEFEIKVRDDLDKSSRLPTSLVRGLRRVSINELADAEHKQGATPSNIVQPAAASAGKGSNRPAAGIKALMTSVPRNEHKHNSANKETCLPDDSYPDSAAADDANNGSAEPGDDDLVEQPSDSGSDLGNNEKPRQEASDVSDAAAQDTLPAAFSGETDSNGGYSTSKESLELPEKPGKDKVPEKPQRQRQQRQRRKDIDSTGIEAVLQDVPKRMTRSMAKKIGVQPPRRYFGEGVSASQILRPAKSAPATRKPRRETDTYAD